MENLRQALLNFHHRGSPSNNNMDVDSEQQQQPSRKINHREHEDSGASAQCANAPGAGAAVSRPILGNGANSEDVTCRLGKGLERGKVYNFYFI